MAIDQNPHLIIPVKIYTYYAECKPGWLDKGGWMGNHAQRDIDLVKGLK
jgi:hypothetical protein